jgi:integrase/recombinase XerD
MLYLFQTLKSNQMATVKIVIRSKNKNSRGEVPLCIRITKNRRTKYIFTDYRILPEHWDKVNCRVRKSHRNSTRLNAFLSQKLSDTQNNALELETREELVLVDQIKSKSVESPSLSFFKFADNRLADLKSNSKVASYRKTKAIVGKVKSYMGKSDLLFEQITPMWLKDYEQHLKSEKDNRPNTINSNFRCIKAIINRAIAQELIPESLTPFRRYKLTTEKVNKDFLTEAELKMLEAAPVEAGSMKSIHLDMYLFSAMGGGFRISDLLLMKWKHCNGDRIIMQTKKTGSSVSVIVRPKAKRILDKYLTKDTESENFIFPVLKNEVDYSDAEFLYNAISSATAYANDDMKEIARMVGIEKKVSMHSARHTFATLALLKGIPLSYVSKILGHGNTITTQGYTKLIDTEIDKAMEVFE